MNDIIGAGDVRSRGLASLSRPVCSGLCLDLVCLSWVRPRPRLRTLLFGHCKTARCKHQYIRLEQQPRCPLPIPRRSQWQWCNWERWAS